MAEPLSQGASHDSEKRMEASDHIEDKHAAPAGRPTFGQKCKRHCGRFWWIYIIILCLIILIVALLVVYAGMPHIAQKDVDNTTLEVTEIQYLDPTENSIVLTEKALLHNPNAYTPTLDAFNASLYLITNGTRAAEPILVEPLPKVLSTKPTREVLIDNANITFSSPEQATAYTVAVMNNEYVTTTLRGKTKLHLGALPVVDVKYRPKITHKGLFLFSASDQKRQLKNLGLNSLKGFNVTCVKINATALSGPNLSGFAYVPNPSVMTIAMGNVTLSLSTTKSGTVGNVTINDMTLRPGNNTLPMTGTMNQTLVLQNLNNGLVDLTITGTDSIYNGQHLTYYEKALQSNLLSLTLNVTQILMNSL